MYSRISQRRYDDAAEAHDTRQCARSRHRCALHPDFPQSDSAFLVAPGGVSEATRRSPNVRILVDLVRCQSYGQCIYAAPSVFRFNGEQSLEFDYAPDDALREQVERAVAACPVQAIRIGLPDAPLEEQRVDARGKA